jgi:hypothetical protein
VAAESRSFVLCIFFRGAAFPASSATGSANPVPCEIRDEIAAIPTRRRSRFEQGDQNFNKPNTPFLNTSQTGY